MAGRVSIQCPGCLAKLNLADDSKLGKKIKCPKCSDIFVAAVAEDDDMEDLQDDDAPAKSDGGRKRPAAVGKKGGKKGKSSGGGGSNTPLIAGGAVAVVVLIGAGLFFAGVFGGGNKPLPAPPMAEVPAAAPAVVAAAPVAPAAPAITATERTLGLRWMPAGTELVVHVKIADLWQAPLLKKLVDMPEVTAVVERWKTNVGLAPTDIESVSIGFADMQGIQTMAMSQMMGLPASNAPKVLAVVRTKKPMSLDEILKTAPDIQAAEHGSKKFLQPTGGIANDGGGWLADSTTLILAPLDQLKAAMDRGESTTPARKELLFADAAPHVVLLFAPKDLKSLTQGAPIPPMSTAPNVDAMGKALSESLTAFSLGITLRGGFDLQTSLLLKDTDSAGKVKVGFDEGIVEGRKQFDAMKMTAPPLLAELGEMLLANLKIDVQGQIVKVSTGLPDSAQQKLVEDLPPVMAMMALAGGMNFGGGNPFAEPGTKFPGAPSGPGFGPPGFGPGGMPPGFGDKNPGATEPVNAELANGIPDGTTLTASTSWRQFPSFTADGKSSVPMQVMLDLKGDALARICGFGQVSIKTGSLAGGGTLKVSRTETLEQPNALKSLIPFDAADPSPFKPEGTLRITFTADTPSDKETTIGTLEGTFKILTSDDPEEFTIDEAPKAAKRPLTDPGLKAAGVKLVKSSSPLGENLTLSSAKGFFLGKAKATNPDDSNGLTMFFNPEMEKNQTVQKLTWFGPGDKFPEKLQVQFKVFKGVKEQTVSFKFADVPLPSPETKPKVQEGGQQPPFGQPAPNAGPQAPNGLQAPNGPQAPNGLQPPNGASQPPAVRPQP